MHRFFVEQALRISKGRCCCYDYYDYDGCCYSENHARWELGGCNGNEQHRRNNVTAVHLNQLFYRGTVGKEQVVFSSFSKKPKLNKVRRPTTNSGDRRSHSRRNTHNQSFRSSLDDRPTTAPMSLQASHINETKLNRLSNRFRQDAVETFAEYQKRKRPRKNPYLSEPHARPTLVDIGGAQKSFFKYEKSGSNNVAGQNTSEVIDHATDASFMEQVPETMKSSLSNIQKRSKAIAEDRREAKLQLFNDIIAIRDTLPLEFLFEHNLTGFVVERGMRKARQILEKFRNRALSFGFEHWTTWNKWSREKQKEEQMRQFAMAHGQEKLKQFKMKEEIL